MGMQQPMQQYGMPQQQYGMPMQAQMPYGQQVHTAMLPTQQSSAWQQVIHLFVIDIVHFYTMCSTLPRYILNTQTSLTLYSSLTLYILILA